MKKILLLAFLVFLTSCDLLISDEDLGCTTCTDSIGEVVKSPFLNLSGANSHDLESSVDNLNLYINDTNPNSTNITCTITPDIATQTGLTFDGANCLISGTPNTLSSTTTYTVTATNDDGMTSSITLDLAVHIKDVCLSPTFTAATPSGSGTSGDPYLICTAAQFDTFVRANSAGASQHFRMMKDLDLTSVTLPLGSLANGSVFDGNGYTIRNASHTGATDIGIFLSVNNATVRNLTLDSNSITGTDRIGLLAGTLVSGTLENISVLASNTLNSTNSSTSSGVLIGEVDVASRMDNVLVFMAPSNAFTGCIVGNGGADLGTMPHAEVYYEPVGGCQVNGASSKTTLQMSDPAQFATFPARWDKASAPITLINGQHPRYYGP